MIYFENDQWAVNEHGLDCKQHLYEIDAERLTELHIECLRYMGEVIYFWPVHMASKPWVDTEQFLTAFLQALVWHAGTHPGITDLLLIRDSMLAARELSSFERANA